MIRQSTKILPVRNFITKYNRFLATVAAPAQVQPQEKCPISEGSNGGKVEKSKTQLQFSSTEYNDARSFDEVPGPKVLPVLGITHHFMPGGKFYQKGFLEIQEIANKEYGDIAVLRGLMKRNLVMLYDPSDIELIFRTEGSWPVRRGMETFQYYREHTRPDVFKNSGGILTEQGEKWQEIRTKTNPILMKPTTVKNYVAPIDEVACDFVERIRKIRDDKNEVPADFSNELNKWALESVGVFALETRLGVLKDLDPNSNGQKFIETVHDFFELTYELEVKPNLWMMTGIKTPMFKKMMKTLDDITNFTMIYIDEAMKKVENSHQSDPDPNRELSVLEKMVKIDRQVAIVMTLDILFAGIDTTSGFVKTLLHLLAVNPEKQEKLRQEIFEKLPQNNSKWTPELLKSVPYLRACMKELLRVKSVVIGNARTTVQDLVIKGYQIPKGSEVMIPSTYLASSEQHYKDAHKFIPERWLTNNPDSEIESAKNTHPFVYMPFGFGPRTCIGKRFAELEVETLITRILRNYKVEWHYGEMEYGKQLLNVPQGDLKFRFNDL